MSVCGRRTAAALFGIGSPPCAAAAVTAISRAGHGCIRASACKLHAHDSRTEVTSSGLQTGTPPEQLATDIVPLLGQYIVAQKGKKNYFLLKLV